MGYLNAVVSDATNEPIHVTVNKSSLLCRQGLCALMHNAELTQFQDRRSLEGLVETNALFCDHTKRQAHTYVRGRADTRVQSYPLPHACRRP